MRVGEILLHHGWVDPTSLQRAIAEQRHTGKRLCSLLIARGMIDPDHASRALGEQHGVAAVLQRHLEQRDRAVVAMIPGALARGLCALPIGRSRTGDLIVGVRDPLSELQATIQAAARTRVILAVAPASQLESLVDQTYEPTSEDGFDVDLTTGPIAVIGESLPGEIGEYSLVGLDDIRVTRDPLQIASTVRPPKPSIPRPITPQPTHTATQHRSQNAMAIPVIGHVSSGPIRALTLEQALLGMTSAVTSEDAVDLAMRYVRGRWAAALLFVIRDGAALGHRGHGPALTDDAVQAVAIPLATATIVKLAHDTRRLAIQPPPDAGAIQDRLARVLGSRTPIAAPVVVAEAVPWVLAVGEPNGDDGAADLEYVVAALGEALTQIRHT
ncbi:MAG: hypothetical protein WKG01_16970 [Kofleriaceae bacterium]